MTAPTTPDLTLYHVIHRAMKADAARLANAVAGIDPGDLGRAGAVERWFNGYLGELHDHHTIEDEIFFPALVEKVPVFTEQVGRIDRDHARLHELVEWNTTALRDLAGGGGTWAEAQAEATRSTYELAALLDEHLGFEDQDVLPLFTRHFTVEEYDELDKTAAAKPNIKQLLFTIPWAIEVATEEERATTFDKTPFIFKLLWYVRRRPYARLSRTVFAEAPATLPADQIEVA
jgi:hypothetical protein